MNGDYLMESSTLDELDRQIIRSLQLSPRAAFSLLGEVLAVSEQTVARRYRRMRGAGLLRVIGVVRPDALGQSTWMVRIQCRPTGASALAGALAQRDDVGWVTVLGGGSEVMCVVRSITAAARDDLLVQRLPRTTQVLSIAPSVVLRVFVGASVAEDWAELAGLLSPDQRKRIKESAEPLLELTRSASLDASDAALLDVLSRDGRATYATLAAAANTSETRIARRLATLLGQGVVYLDVDIAMSALGLNMAATLWLTVSPAHLEQAGETLSQQTEVAFAAAVSGPHNLTASVYCRDLDALYSFVTDKVGSLPGVQTMEIAPVVRHVKQSGSLVSGDRFIE